MSKKKQPLSKKSATISESVMVPISYSWPWYIIPPTILAALSWLFYYPSLHYSFQFDDIVNITKYFDIRNNSLGAVFFTGTRWISYWLNAIYYSFNKFDPFLYRVGNVTFHTITGVLVFFLLFFVLRRRKEESFFKTHCVAIAFFTAALFLLHPVQTQTVSYVIQGQLEGLAALTIMAMALCFVHAATAIGTKKYIYTVLLFTAALFSCGTKEIAILSPVLLVIIDWFFIAQGQWKQLYKRLWLHLALLCVVIGTYLYFLKPQFFIDILGLKIIAHNNIGNVITHNPADEITPFIFLISQFKVLLHYIGIFFWPFNMSVEYDWKVAEHFFAFDCIAPFLVLLCLAALIIQELRKNSMSLRAFGGIWFFVCMLPRSSIIPSPELVVDYKTYTASIGLLFLIASAFVYGVQKFFERNSFLHSYRATHGAAMSIACLIIIALPVGLITVERNKIWRSGAEFWLNIIHNAPNKARAYNNYGVEISQHQNKYAEAIPYFKKAIEMDSKYPDPCNNLAVAYSALGNLDQAIQVLYEHIRKNPNSPEIHNNFASFLVQKKQYAYAEKILHKALELRPHYGKAYFNLGRIHFEQNNIPVAYNYFKKACVEADFDNDLGFTVYGQTCVRLAKFGEAIDAFKKAVELSPHVPDTWLNLGNAYYVAQSYNQARDVFIQLTQRWPDCTQGWFNLGETHLALNDAQNAYDCYKRIEKYTGSLPQVSMKIAGCLQKMGASRA